MLIGEDLFGSISTIYCSKDSKFTIRANTSTIINLGRIFLILFVATMIRLDISIKIIFMEKDRSRILLTVGLHLLPL